MTVKSLLGYGFLLTCCLLEVSSRPNNESTKMEIPLDESQEQPPDKTDRLIDFTRDTTPAYNENTWEIMDKIRAINDGLKKPQKQQLNFNKPKQTPGSYGIDRETLEKIQQIIASGKIKQRIDTLKQHENNFLDEDSDNIRQYKGRALQMNPNEQPSMSFMPFPYIMNMPVVVMPSPNQMRFADNDINTMQSNINFQARQEQPSPFPSFPSFPSNFQWPFQFQWPFANYFPFIVKDPFLAVQQGGGWNNFFEYGQTADVCTRKQKSFNNEGKNKNDEMNRLLKMIATFDNNDTQEKDAEYDSDSIDPVLNINTRQSRAIKKGTLLNSAPTQEIESNKMPKKIYVTKPVVTRKPPKKIYVEEIESPQDNKSSAEDGDLRFPFGGFDWFGNKKPVAPSPGFFINRLRVRKGGVAIAGPGGVATAGKGGTAIVGPGGLAYTQPGGLAVAGPAARVIALSSETDLNSVVSRLRDLNDTSVPRQQPIREGKLVATGPVIYYHPDEQTSDRERIHWQRSNQSSSKPDIYKYDGEKFTEVLTLDSKHVLQLNPVAHAVGGARAVAIANPESHVAIRQKNMGTVVHLPKATAVVGPGGIAHAQSDLYLYEFVTNDSRASIQYLPFYGGAKGQYLEVKKDNRGTVLSEKIVAEDSISSENILKNSNDNLLSKVLLANLHSLKSLSSSLIRLHNLGSKLNSLNSHDKTKYKNQLTSLGETASNTIKLIEEVGDDISVLFKRNATLRRYEDDNEEDVGEEGISIDNPEEPEEDIVKSGTIAEAKPVGLAVIGENGLAASRPVATAVAESGVALARPIATAIAGIDPGALGFSFADYHQTRTIKG